VGGNETIKRRVLIASTATHAVIGEGVSARKNNGVKNGEWEN